VTGQAHETEFDHTSFRKGKVVDQSRIVELKSALQSRLSIIDEGMKKGVQIEGENVTVSAETAAAIKQAMAEATEIKSLIDAEQFGVKTRHWLDAPTEDSVALEAQTGEFIRQAKSLGQGFIESREFKEFKEKGAHGNMQEAYTVEQYDVTAQSFYGQKDVFTGMVNSVNPNGFGGIQFDPMIPRQQRTTRVRDLFPQAATSANLIEYFKVTGYADGDPNKGNVGSVRERAAADGTSAPTGTATDTFGRKPKSNLKFESAQAAVRTIAHWEAAHRNVLDDEPALRATIDNELLYGLALEEDRQIIDGSGANEELLGILRTSDIQGYTQANNGATPAVATETKLDALRRAATLVGLANFDPRGYVLHDFDWEDIELTKTDQGQYILATNIAIGAQTQVWRQPVVATPAMPEGTFVTGAWGLGAQLYDRQQANVRTAEQHEDFFVRNAIAILVEERLAFAVKRPESFVKGTFV